MLNRRQFVAGSTGIVAAATMAEAASLVEFLDWLRRKPAFSFPSQPALPFHIKEIYINGLRLIEGKDFVREFDRIRYTNDAAWLPDIVFDRYRDKMLRVGASPLQSYAVRVEIPAMPQHYESAQHGLFSGSLFQV
jgi:hypothetical protein